MIYATEVSLALQQLHRVKSPSQHFRRVRFHPVRQHACIDASEVDLPRQIAPVELAWLQTGMLAMHAGLNLVARDEERRSRSVVGALRRILRNAPSEFRKRHEQHSVHRSVFLQPLHESRQGVAELPEKLCLPL